MKNKAEALYLERKIGKGMGKRYFFSSLMPMLLIGLITLILVFLLVFISSMTEEIDRMIALLTGGSLSSWEDVSTLLPEGSRCDEVKNGNGILYSDNGRQIAQIKGVDISEYFLGEREKALLLEMGDKKNNSVILSHSLSASLGLTIGDKLTLLVYDEEKNRTRPVLVTVAGIYSSGYAELDKYLAFCDISLLKDNPSRYEILLRKGENVEKVQQYLMDNGYYTYSYKENNRALYQNVQSSFSILYIILVFASLLGAYFASDATHVYVSRDQKDILSLSILGLSDKRIKKIYVKYTLIMSIISITLGTLLGLLLSLFSPSLITLLSKHFPSIFDYYISTFTLSIPLSKIALMFVLMIAIIYLSLRFTLGRVFRREKSEISYE